MITYQLDDYVQSLPELMELYPDHYDEVAANRDIVKLNMNYEHYKKLYDVGILHLVTARDDGKLIGYYISFVMPHLHYKDSLTAYPDILYLVPAYRKGRTGINLFKKHEETCRDKGVQRIYTGVKLELDFGKILDYLGYKAIERIYTKILD